LTNASVPRIFREHQKLFHWWVNFLSFNKNAKKTFVRVAGRVDSFRDFRRDSSVGSLCAGHDIHPSRPPGAIIYPATRTTNQIDFYNGVSVADPYRWLEDDNSPETKAWVVAQNAVTFDFLKKIPQRDRIRKRLTKLWNFERYGVPFKEGGRTFSAATTVSKIKACFTRCRRSTPSARVAGPEQAFDRRHNGALRHRREPRCKISRLRDFRSRLGLGGMEGARCWQPAATLTMT